MIRLIALAVVLGAGVGLIESGILVVAARSGVAIRMGFHYAWMVPLADTIVFLVVGLVLAVAGRWWSPVTRRRVTVGLLAGLAALSFLLVIESLHVIASLVLAAGIGVQAGRLAGRDGVERAMRWAPAASVALLLGIGLIAVRSLHRVRSEESAALAALVDAPADAPNVLLLILDTVRSKSLGLYGGPTEVSPHLDALAARGVVFDRAVAPAPWTLPSHASMFTGRWPFELDAGWRHPLGSRYPTLAERMAAQGYVTAGFVGNLLYASRASGLQRGFIRYEDHDLSLAELALGSSIIRTLVHDTRVRRLLRSHELFNRKDARGVNRGALRWFDERADDRPWFVFLNYYDAHEPHFPPDSLLRGRSWNHFTHQGGITKGSNAWVTSKWTMSAEDVALHEAGYLAAIRRMDEELGRLMDELERRGALDNTIVIVASDHGEQLGEGGLFEHNNSLYPSAIEVPLILLWPGRIPAGVRVRTAVSLRDLAATIVDLIGVRDSIPGVSLADTWGDGTSARHDAPSFLGFGNNVEQPNTPIARGDELTALVRTPYLYIRNGDGTDEMYDLLTDRDALSNLAARAENQPMLLDLRAAVYRLITGGEIPELPIRPPTGPGARPLAP